MKYSLIPQHSQEDCGAACLASIAKHYGRTFSLARTREAVGTGQLGSTMLGLKRGAEALGFNAKGVKANAQILEHLSEISLPAILHWKGYHYVVLYGQKGGKYVVADPGIGILYLSRQELLEGWENGAMLLLELDSARFAAQPEDKTGNFQRFLRPTWQFRGLLLEALVINVVLGLLSLTSPFLIQILTDDILVRGDSRLLGGVIIAVVVMNLVSTALGVVQSHLIAYFAQRLELGLVLEFCRQILRLPLSYYESRRSGEVVSRLGDITEVNQLVSQVVIGLPSQVFIAIVSFGFMVFYSWSLTIASIVIAVLISLSVLPFLPTLQQQTRRLLVLAAENQGVLVETFKGALTMKTTSAADQFWEELQSRFGRLGRINFRIVQISIVSGSLSSVLSAVGGVGLLWLGSNLIITNQLSIGQLLAFNTMSGNFLALIGTLVGFVDEMTRAKTAIERLEEVIDTPAETGKVRPYATIAPDADITCADLNFHYAGQVDLLKDFSVKIPGGRVTSLIGKSGCGKSTLAKLIAGLYPLQSGNIRVGLYNLGDLSLDCLRRQVVLVPQEAHFWSRSIIENFQLGNPSINLEQIVRACQITGADQFISNLPDQYQTVLGEFGANISGGQRQRLAIARAIASAPPVLILDESTGSLDPVSEAEVLDKLLYHRRGQTTIIISHRPRVVSRADWLVLLDQGKLILAGPTPELQNIPGSHLDFLSP
jgi:ATP-binding cassette subfamily C protein